jgi:hypothetical protein
MLLRAAMEARTKTHLTRRDKAIPITGTRNGLGKTIRDLRSEIKNSTTLGWRRASPNVCA